MQNKKFSTLSTPFLEEMNRECPWEDYPRPSMRRDSYLSLNGEWHFAVTKGDSPDEYTEKILVPFPPESMLSGIEREINVGEVMFYRRSFTLGEEFLRERVILHFGAVDTIAEVVLNGELLLSHIGGYIPFSIDITEHLCENNILTVRVVDNLEHTYPYGKQRRDRGGMWYTPVSGIWQSVWLESVPKNYIESLKITPSLDSVKIEVVGGEDEKEIILADGTHESFSGNEITLSPKEIKHWSPENPVLYEFTLKSGEDEVRSYFALREISIKKVGGVPRICLNGKPYLFNGLLDQGYFPDGIFLPATAEGYRRDILVSKSLGFNMLRKHIKVEPEIFYYLCDSLGMVVFQDMVNNSDYSFFFDTALPTVGLKRLPDKNLHKDERSRRAFRECMLETINHLYNFPSVLYYTIFNEGWGQFCADENYAIAREMDPTRIYDATSGWFWESESDVDSHHVYFKPIKLKAAKEKPIVISEFGGYSHRVEGHLFGPKNYGYRLYDKIEDFERAFIKLYTDEVSPQMHLGISALVYTQVSDVEDETNGIMTYDRRVIKLDEEKIKAVMEEIKSKIG